MKSYVEIINEVDGLEKKLHAIYNDVEFTEQRQSIDPYLCPQCGTGRLRIINGRFGPFYGCSRYPSCRYTKNQ